MDHNFTHALWLGGVEKYMPMRIYVHGEYKDKTSQKWFMANKGDKPTRYTFGVQEKDILWLHNKENNNGRVDRKR